MPVAYFNKTWQGLVEYTRNRFRILDEDFFFNLFKSHEKPKVQSDRRRRKKSIKEYGKKVY